MDVTENKLYKMLMKPYVQGLCILNFIKKYWTLILCVMKYKPFMFNINIEDVIYFVY